MLRIVRVEAAIGAVEVPVALFALQTDFDVAIELLDEIDPQLGLPLKLVPQGRDWLSGFFLGLGVEPLDDLFEQGANRPISTLASGSR